MSLPTSTKQWTLNIKPTDFPVLSGDDSNFVLETKQLPTLDENQVLLKTLYLSNDPAQRGWISANVKPERMYTVPPNVGDPMPGRGVAEVIESKSKTVTKGSMVTASTGWREYVVVNAKDCQSLPELPGNLSVTQYLGALGFTGLTAYYGLVEVVQATAADSVVISGAAGATGSMAVQVAKHIIGCKHVVGIAGSDEKCRWVESLGADICLNYKSPNFEKELVKATEGYVQVYFDNVGGKILDLMLTRMAMHGRVAACGSISSYNSTEATMLENYKDIITMRLQIRGFIVLDYINRFKEVVGIFQKAVKEGKLKLEGGEQVVDTPFESIPETWMKLFEGGNTGKLVTKVL